MLGVRSRIGWNTERQACYLYTQLRTSMIKESIHGSPEVAAHLLALMKLRNKSKRIHHKIEEVTARLLEAQRVAESATAKLDLLYPRKDDEGPTQSIVSALKELDDLLGQPDLITRDELRSHLQELIRQFGDPGND